MEIIRDTIKKIENDFKVGGLYKNTKDKNIFCIHINSIVNIGLSELGYNDLVLENIEKIIESPLFSKKDKLFYREINEKGEVINSNFNTCKNALAVLSLIACNKKSTAKKIVEALYKSSLFNNKNNLFYREFNSINKFLNPLIVVQTNLWMVIALAKLEKFSEAQKIIKALEHSNFNKEENLFFSLDCETELETLTQKIHIKEETKNYFSDDQGLAVIAYKLLKEESKAKNLLEKVLNSNLYDKQTGLFNRSFNSKKIDKTKTSYKNGILGVVLGMMKYEKELDILQESVMKIFYDPKEFLFNFSEKDFTKIPDNSILSLLATNFGKLRHIIF